MGKKWGTTVSYLSQSKSDDTHETCFRALGRPGRPRRKTVVVPYYSSGLGHATALQDTRDVSHGLDGHLCRVPIPGYFRCAKAALPYVPTLP